MFQNPVAMAVRFFVFIIGFSGCEQAAPAASSRMAPGNLSASIKAFGDVIPSLLHMMTDDGDHFTNLWFAGRADNWPLADLDLSETKSHPPWAVRRILIRKDSQIRDINLGSILEAFENSQLTRSKTEIAGKDEVGLEKVYKERLSICYSCRQAVDKPYLRPQLPKELASPGMNFDLKANWPL
jgi:hypothetical protein